MRLLGAKTDHLREALRRLEWDDLRTALFLARSGSVRKAARTLGVSHSTVLRRIDALERGAGVRLFDKTAEGYELTVAGQDVFDTAGALEELVAGLERRVHGRDLQLSGPIRVTLPELMLPPLIPAFRDFVRAHPAIEVTIALDHAFVDLAHRAADIAVRIAPDPPADLVGRRVGVARAGVYGAEAYLKGRSTKDLESLEWIGLAEGSPLFFAQWMQKHVPKARVALRVDQPWALRDAVDAGLGVTLVPCAFGERPGWQRVRLVPEIAAPVWVLTHKDLRGAARVRLLRDHLAEAIAGMRKAFEGR